MKFNRGDKVRLNHKAPTMMKFLIWAGIFVAVVLVDSSFFDMRLFLWSSLVGIIFGVLLGLYLGVYAIYEFYKQTNLVSTIFIMSLLSLPFVGIWWILNTQ